MPKFKVLAGGGSKQKPDYEEIYRKALVRSIEEWERNPDDKMLTSRVIFYGVNFYNRSPYDKLNHDEIGDRLYDIHVIEDMIGQLTPAELMQIFPVDKRYDGDKYQSKDYFYTMDELKKHGLNKPIGDKVNEILWDFTNEHICGFVVGKLEALSALRRLEGGKSLIEEFAEAQGSPLTVYYTTTDSKGRTFMTDGKTGKRQRVYRKKPRYLRPVVG